MSGTTYDDTKNTIPIADAGTPQTVKPLDMFTLDGSDSKDGDGNITSYSWKQIQGPNIKLDRYILSIGEAIKNS